MGHTCDVYTLRVLVYVNRSNFGMAAVYKLPADLANIEGQLAWRRVLSRQVMCWKSGNVIVETESKPTPMAAPTWWGLVTLLTDGLSRVMIYTSLWWWVFLPCLWVCSNIRLLSWYHQTDIWPIFLQHMTNTGLVTHSSSAGGHVNNSSLIRCLQELRDLFFIFIVCRFFSFIQFYTLFFCHILDCVPYNKTIS